MKINNVISKYSPQQLAAFISEMQSSGNFKIELKVEIAPVSNEIDTAEALRILKITDRTLQKYITDGRVKMQKRGRRNVYYRDQILQAIDNGLI